MAKIGIGPQTPEAMFNSGQTLREIGGTGSDFFRYVIAAWEEFNGGVDEVEMARLQEAGSLSFEEEMKELDELNELIIKENN
jgi:hypothetical protein